MAKRKPQVGDMAWHKGGLDPRPVAKVSEDGKEVKLTIGSIETAWLRADNYDYEENSK